MPNLAKQSCRVDNVITCEKFLVIDSFLRILWGEGVKICQYQWTNPVAASARLALRRSPCRVVRACNFFNPTQPIANWKLWTHKPTQPNPQPNRTPCYTQRQTFAHKEDDLGTLFHRTNDVPNCKSTKRTVRYKLVTLYTTSFRIFGTFSERDPTQLTKNTKNLYPIRTNPTQPNPWVNPIRDTIRYEMLF